ncbi:hypothetical protein [Loigolactobacillus coryniformis]|uniref:hypothetical protein n=1 Tax=Loigolactobacillus coryniformis TaxID=1610 RepID=UPI001F0037F5|nr:hypothetical protein [Loigolactobacillus coryniformis]
MDHSIWLSRSVDINDIISNVFGVLIGYIVLKAVGLVFPKLVQLFKYFNQAS